MAENPERPPGVKVVRKRLADGTVKEYRYDRSARRRVRLKQHGAIRQLAEIYVKSPEFVRLSRTWQTARRYYFGILEDELDWLTIDDLNDRESRGDFYELRDQFAKTPDKADKLIDALKGLLSWAYERNRIRYNHALGIPHLSKSGQRRNEIIWTEDHEAIVYALCPQYLVRAFRFALFSAMRQSDMCALKWANYKDGLITYHQGKTGAKVYLPVYALLPFQELIESLPQTSEFMLTSVSGGQIHAGNLRANWAVVLSKTDLRDQDLHWHDIRGTTVTRLLEAGCTDAEVAAITGHAIGPGTKLGDYAARTRKLALNAYGKWATMIESRPVVIQFAGEKK